MDEYPEHEKLQVIAEESQAIGEFLDWLADTKGYEICKFESNGREAWAFDTGSYERIQLSKERLLADYFGIDLVVIEAEKRKMIDDLRARQ